MGQPRTRSGLPPAREDARVAGCPGRRLSGVAASPPPPAPVFVLCIQISRGGRRAPSGPPRACSRTPPRVHGTSFSSCLPTAGPTLTEMNIAKTYVALGPREPCRTGLGRGRRPDSRNGPGKGAQTRSKRARATAITRKCGACPKGEQRAI